MGALTHHGEVLQRLPADASQINFDKSGTNLSSTQTENAIKEVNTKANTLQSEKADTDIVAADFNSGTSYTAGNYCIYEGKFYKFKANHSGAWSAADVDEIKIAGELASLKSGLTHMGNITKLGYVQGTGEVSLSDVIDNYRYLFFTVGYYDSGFPSYGTAMFPTLMAPRGVGARVVCATDDDTNAKSVVFTLDDTNNKLSVSGTYDATRYLTLYGVV